MYGVGRMRMKNEAVKTVLGPIVISASRRTDIPAFHGAWMEKRLAEGMLRIVNPMNPKQVSEYRFGSGDVAGIVFWTKNPKAFIPRLDALDALGYRYYFQYTLNDYPEAVEPHVGSCADRIETFLRLSERLGSSGVVWRYDPVVLSTALPFAWHLERFSAIAERLAGATDQAVISFVDPYRGAAARIAAAGGVLDGSENPLARESELRAFAQACAEKAAAHGMALSSCCEGIDLATQGVSHGACIDARRIALRGSSPHATFTKKDPGQRGECLCSRSIDVGAYDTCSFGCRYCYATGPGSRPSGTTDPESLCMGEAHPEAVLSRKVVEREECVRESLW